MSLLTLIQDVCNELGLPEPSSVVNNTDKTVKQLLALTYRTGDELRNRISWPQLNRDATLTLVTSQANYAFPSDFDRQIFETHWAQNDDWPLIGPMTPQEYKARTEGIIASSPRQRFRVKGWDDKQIYIEPTPASGDNGNTLIFEYQSERWFRPVTWTASTVFSTNTYCWNDGNIYKTTAGGTTGATAPTHTSGSASDGGVTWDFDDTDYLAFTSDSDEFLLHEKLIGLSVQWRFMRQKGLPYEGLKMDFEAKIKRQASALSGATTLSLNSRSAQRLLSSENVPDTGYG